ncbi:MAG TPA: tRNA lysidine(34) synthetase TilS [Oscillospiraceae bacterium]|nr:tRNA lysidine(34) synthetase TilS [Oscillospiraceae bacterium]
MLQKFNTKLISENDFILVGLSGGADSVSLLLNLLELKEKLNLSLSAVHINHCLRGEESDNDEKFCIGLCEKSGVTLYTERINVLEYCNENNFSVEEGARILRYKAFEKYRNGGKIATAHNLSDNAETVIFNLTRGTGLKGLCGIPEKRDDIIRPLLSVSRSEIEEYLKEKNQPYVTDSTNLCEMYSRNKIRKNVIPVLSEINPAFLYSVKNTSDILKDEEDFLNSECERAYRECKVSENQLDLKKMSDFHTAIRKRMLKKFLDNNGLKLSYKRIDEIENNCTDRIFYKNNLSGNVYIIVKRGIISIEKLNGERRIFEQKLVIGDNNFFDKLIEVSVTSQKNYIEEQNVHKKFAIYYIDYGKIQGDIVLRNRREGDKIRFEGKDFTSSVKKLFNERIPLCERDKTAFICDEDGIILIEDFGISDRVKTDSNTADILKIVIKDRSQEVEQG